MTTISKNEKTLFSAIKIGSLNLENRIVMAPLTRNRAGEGNVPQDINVEYYQQRATAGLIITEATQISPQGIGYPSTPGIHSPEQICGWQKITDAVHQKGGLIFLQLWHVGRISHPSLQLNDDLPVAPSAITPQGEAITYQGPQAYVQPRALETGEIEDIVAQYRIATENANAAGFDGVEIHAANGYLIDQFIRDSTNQRDDQYGGSIENRTRFLEQIVQASVNAWDASRIGVRISPENTFNDISDSSPQSTFNFVAKRLSRYNLAYLHVLEGNMAGTPSTFNYQEIKQLFGGPYMANFAYTQDRANCAIAKNKADLVAFGSLYIANPDLVERFKQNTALNSPDQATYYGGNEIGYTDYPFLNQPKAASNKQATAPESATS